MGVSGPCRVRDVHVRMLVGRYRRMLGELKYHTRRQPSSPRSEKLSIGCATLAQAVLCIQPGIDLKSIVPIRFTPPAPFSSAQLTREILAALRREPMLHCARSLANALLLHRLLRLETPEQLAAFSRQVDLRLVTLENQGAVQKAGATWTLPPLG
jgi:hypothetical protein